MKTSTIRIKYITKNGHTGGYTTLATSKTDLRLKLERLSEIDGFRIDNVLDLEINKEKKDPNVLKELWEGDTQ
jgi:hypothetical protein